MLLLLQYVSYKVCITLNDFQGFIMFTVFYIWEYLSTKDI